MYVASVLRRIHVIHIYEKQGSSWLHANVTQSALLRIRPSSDARATKGFAYSDRYACLYVGELESSNLPARYDLVPHFIDPPFYTNKLAVPPRLPTPKESYPNTTGRSPLFRWFRKSMTFSGS